MWNMIPDELRKIMEPAHAPMTGANYVTVTPDQQVLPPSNQAVGQDLLNQMAQDYNSMVQSQLAANLWEFNPDVLMHNSPHSVLGVTQHFSVDSLLGNPNNPPITHNVNAFQPNVISDVYQPSSSSYLIDGAWAGAQQNHFVNADDYDNLIEITPEDAAQRGGIRAWGGNDKVMGTPGSDTANGNQGNDHIFGHDGDDMLLGGQGDDYVVGGAGRDVLVGEAGIDVLIGNAGDDMLIADGWSADGKGDFLIGSAGADEFIMMRSNTLANDAAYAHRILDFDPSVDTIKFADFQGMNEMSFASVDVNHDNKADTAIVCSDGVVGVVMSKAPSEIPLSSMYMVGPQDPTLSKISQFSMLSSHMTLSNPTSASIGG
jgi:hypothetical protein